jgi:hypothetical protein
MAAATATAAEAATKEMDMEREAATNSRILFSLVHLLPQKMAASSERAGQEDPERSGGSLCT